MKQEGDLLQQVRWQLQFPRRPRLARWAIDLVAFLSHRRVAVAQDLDIRIRLAVCHDRRNCALTDGVSQMK